MQHHMLLIKQKLGPPIQIKWPLGNSVGSGQRLNKLCVVLNNLFTVYICAKGRGAISVDSKENAHDSGVGPELSPR